MKKENLKAPTHDGWLVAYQDKDGETHATNYFYKSKYQAQKKADELMLIEQKQYFITECTY